MAARGRDIRTLEQYKHICEVPADLLTPWLAKFCFACGESVDRIQQQWKETNQEWAEEADPDTLDYWSERLGLSHDGVRRRITEGLLCDSPPVYTIAPTIDTALDGAADRYHICSGCFSTIFDDIFDGGKKQMKDIRSHMLLLSIAKTLKIDIE